jgi:hypothetical protein
VGIAPKLTDAELVTLAVLQALLGYTSESRWLRFARDHLGRLFLSLPGQPAHAEHRGRYHTDRQPAVAGLVYILAIAVAASVGATARAARLGAGNCVVGRAVAPLT